MDRNRPKLQGRHSRILGPTVSANPQGAGYGSGDGPTADDCDGDDAQMAEKMTYQLPPLPYDYSGLEPSISERQLRLHHDKHHQAYVIGANADLERLERSRREGTDIDMKALLKELSFNIGGHILHSLFWENMAPAGGEGGGKPGGILADALNAEFGSFERFKKEFTAATGAEGSAWAALSFDVATRRPVIMQIEKHSNHVYPAYPIILVLDLWEHAYYLDYQNERGKYVDAFWNIVNWGSVEKRLAAIPGIG